MRTRLLATLIAVALLAIRAEAEQRVGVFRSTGFPTVDAPPIPNEVLQRALARMQTVTWGSADEFERLKLAPGDVLVLPYGSAFPLEAWPQIRDFVHRGGDLVVLGGAPFHQPVRRADVAWIAGPRQPSFAHELLIGPAEEVGVDDGWKVSLPESRWKAPVSGAKRVWELTLRLSTKAEFPNENGSEGEREAIVRPLVHLADGDGVPRACPLIEIDRLRGEAAGGRWIFATSDAPLTADVIRTIVLRALEGASELDARPELASVKPGETPSIRVTYRRPRTSAAMPSRANLLIRDDAGHTLGRGSVELTGSGDVRSGIGKVPAVLGPGLYHADVATDGGETTTSGFWIRDEKLLNGAPRLTASRDWLRRDGEVFPVIGTTYMASDVHRQFLFEPNPDVWDRDFARMQRLGINFVRTGLWTAWSRAMETDGTPREPFLRALEAYVQTAAKHGIEVAFTFYAFLPPAHGGVNPYLDPRAIEGQKRFVGGIAGRFRNVGWIHYDLINEPSYAPPEGLWSNRPIRDELEKSAWLSWVRERHNGSRGHEVAGSRGGTVQASSSQPRDLETSQPDLALLLREQWGVATDDVLDLPRDRDLSLAAVREDRHPRKTRDFVEFSNEVVARWAATLRDAIRAAGGDVLVTLGQDEGGTGTRPSQQLHAWAVDYTCIHPWWQNDDALANGVFVKVPEKPSLFQETGLMRLEDVDGRPWRSPDVAAAALGRKFAYAFAARSAGAVEWAWNVNPYMPIDNESVIGFFRPDGTAKPEIEVVPKLAKFFATAAPKLEDFEPDPVVVVIPQARLFMGVPTALDGPRRIIRTLAERFGIVPTAISDLTLTPERLANARLVIVASAQFLDARAADALAVAAKRGTKVLVTGAITSDSYGGVPASLAAVVDSGRPVRFREPTRWGNGVLTFDRDQQESLLCSTAPELVDFAGNLWHEPMPVESAREGPPLVALLEASLKAAGVEANPSSEPVAARLLVAPESVLAVVVNESGRNAVRRVVVAGAPRNIAVSTGGWALVLFDRATGNVIAGADSQ